MNTPQLTLGAVEQTDYGSNTIGQPFRPDAYSGWQRIDLYRGQDGKEYPERRFAASRDDFSPMARPMYASRGNCHYHPQCPECWLGFSHTLARHNRCAWNEDGSPKPW